MTTTNENAPIGSYSVHFTPVAKNEWAVSVQDGERLVTVRTKLVVQFVRKSGLSAFVQYNADDTRGEVAGTLEALAAKLTAQFRSGKLSLDAVRVSR